MPLSTVGEALYHSPLEFEQKAARFAVSACRCAMAKSNSKTRVDRGKADRDDGAPLRPKSPGAPAGPTQRMLRVGEMIRHELAAVLSRGEIHDDVLTATVVTIPEVRMSTDLKLATVYVMPLGGRNIEPVVAALNTHKKYIRSIIAKAINLKFAPDVRFKHDETFDEALKIDRLLDSPKVRQDTGK
jgi:ribosome-binding factor A